MLMDQEMVSKGKGDSANRNFESRTRTRTSTSTHYGHTVYTVPGLTSARL
uniref:Uncharacterized protein n=1 Tax=Hyaloperonospora arabidopsidis (strain Emoy2) TaxID=559515 RepID=M4BUP8_HYAAE